jgi:hypothetical protein
LYNTQDDPAFAGQVTDGGRKSNDPIDRLAKQPITEKVVSNKLDNIDYQALHSKLLGFYQSELLRQEVNRRQQAIDADFVDGLQWDSQDAALLRARGQQPLVYNVIATSYQWLLGTEKRGRTDYKILPRQKEASKAAERKSQLLKYLSDVNRSEFHVSAAFADCAKVGVGWLESGVQADDEGEPIFDRRETWRNMLWDSIAMEPDLSDARFMFRSKWMDTDIAAHMFPERKYQIEIAASNTLDFLQALSGSGDDAMDAMEDAHQLSLSSGLAHEQSDRRRLRVIEAWFRVPVEDKYMSGGQFRGELFDPQSQGHMREVEAGRASVTRRVRMRMFVAIMTENGLLHLSKSPYRHNLYPFTPIWAYRMDRDNMPYAPVRQMRDPQSDINKRFSKALYILSTNKTIMDEGAVADMATFQEEANRPDGIIVKRQGKQLEMGVDRELAPAHLDIMSRSISMVQQASGITDENMGRTTNATSGKAIVARQDQGSLATSTIFDNLRYARQVHGEKMLSLTEQFMEQEKQFRITNQRGRPEFITVNDGLPENDIVSSKADFIISEEDWNSTIRQAQTQQLIELMQMLAGTSPEVVMAILDLLIETMDVPQREELVKRVRSLTGAEDPDADPDNPDEETIARKQAQAAQQKMQQRAQEAEVAEKEATAAERQARAALSIGQSEKVKAEIRAILSKTSGQDVDTQMKAIEAAIAIAGDQAVAAVADSFLLEAGFAGQPSEPAPQQPAMPQQQPVAPPVDPMAQEQPMPAPAGPQGGMMP